MKRCTTPHRPMPNLNRTRLSPALRLTEARVIYAVDDMPPLTDLYKSLLETTGCFVRTFNDLSNALEALKTETKRPVLLITDYYGLSMPVDEFINACRSIHPTLPILMASGLHKSHMRFARVRPDYFIHKPFTAD